LKKIEYRNEKNMMSFENSLPLDKIEPKDHKHCRNYMNQSYLHMEL